MSNESAKLDNDLLYLFAEGNYYHMYETFGVHFIKENGKKGAQFNVWAPGALSVCVTGDFCGWSDNGWFLSPVASNGGKIARRCATVHKIFTLCLHSPLPAALGGCFFIREPPVSTRGAWVPDRSGTARPGSLPRGWKPYRKRLRILHKNTDFAKQSLRIHFANQQFTQIRLFLYFYFRCIEQISQLNYTFTPFTFQSQEAARC